MKCPYECIVIINGKQVSACFYFDGNLSDWIGRATKECDCKNCELKNKEDK